MKKYIAVAAASMMLAACQQDTNKTETNKNDGNKAQNTVISEQNKTSYAIGVDMANRLIDLNKNFGASTLDLKAVQKGFADKANDKVTFTDEELQEQLQAFQQQLMTAQQEKQKAKLAGKTTENAAYFEGLANKGFTKTDSGLYYKVLNEGKKGATKPSATDNVKVHYTGTFTDGKQFDSSVGKSPFSFSLAGGVIPGWIEGVQLMEVGSKYQFVIPPELGYGDNDRGPIPGGSILLFDVELLEIVAKKDDANKKEKKAS